MIKLSEGEYSLLLAFNEFKTFYNTLANTGYTESTLECYFYKLRKKKVITGYKRYYTVYLENIEVSKRPSRKEKVLKKANDGRREQAKRLREQLIPPSTAETDGGFHFVNGKRVEHPIKILPLKFTEKGILNVYPEFPKAS